MLFLQSFNVIYNDTALLITLLLSSSFNCLERFAWFSCSFLKQLFHFACQQFINFLILYSNGLYLFINSHIILKSSSKVGISWFETKLFTIFVKINIKLNFLSKKLVSSILLDTCGKGYKYLSINKDIHIYTYRFKVISTFLLLSLRVSASLKVFLTEYAFQKSHFLIMLYKIVYE